jgi:hypothetical protein
MSEPEITTRPGYGPGAILYVVKELVYSPTGNPNVLESTGATVDEALALEGHNPFEEI